MRHKTSGYFLLSALLVSLILGLCILLNLHCPQAVSDDALTQEQLTRGVTLTGWSPPTSVVRPSGCGRCPAGRPRSL